MFRLVRFDILAAVKITMLLFISPEDGDSMFLRNVDIYL
jgi:hypothetical protein